MNGKLQKTKEIEETVGKILKFIGRIFLRKHRKTREKD